MVRSSSSDSRAAGPKDAARKGSKRNKKDLNKRGESKEGTDMDAFYDASEVSHTSSLPGEVFRARQRFITQISGYRCVGVCFVSGGLAGELDKIFVGFR